MWNLYWFLRSDAGLFVLLVLAIAIGAAVIYVAWKLQNDPEAMHDLYARFKRFAGVARRDRRPVTGPFPRRWTAILERNVWHYRLLTASEKRRLRHDVMRFVSEKDWEPARGMKVTDTVKVTIAGQACLLILNYPFDPFAHVTSVIVYPGGFVVPDEDTGAGPTDVLGLAVYRGPVVLAWDQALAGGRGETLGHNVVLHEFAHQLDFAGDDSVPPEIQRARSIVFRQEYEELVVAEKSGTPTILDHYGASNETEFFAVATESFFEDSEALSRDYPTLYAVLRDIYRQDPAERLRRARERGLLLPKRM